MGIFRPQLAYLYYLEISLTILQNAELYIYWVSHWIVRFKDPSNFSLQR